jgi:hypothetical protein
MFVFKICRAPGLMKKFAYAVTPLLFLLFCSNIAAGENETESVQSFLSAIKLNGGSALVTFIHPTPEQMLLMMNSCSLIFWWNYLRPMRSSLSVYRCIRPDINSFSLGYAGTKR